MIRRKREFALLVIFGIALSFVFSPVFAGPSVFNGRLGIIEIDTGGAIYSGSPIGTGFSIEIDLVTGLGTVSNDTIVMPFTALLSGGSLFSFRNNESVDAADAARINSFADTSLVAGELVDLIEFSGEGPTPGGGILAVEVSYILDPLAFDDTNPNNYPPNPDDVLAIIFNVEERDDQVTGIFDSFGAVDFDSVQSPLCSIQLNQANYIDGDTVTADVFRIANLTSAQSNVEWKVWLGIPGIPPISIINLGADGSLVLPAGFDTELGPLPIVPVTAALPRGNYELSCRMLDPVTGGLLWEDLNAFKICENSGWIKHAGNPIFSSSGPGEWDDPLGGGTVLIDPDEPVNKYKRWYVGGVTPSGEGMSIGYATSTDGINWVPYSNNPVMTHGNTWDINGFSGIHVIKDGSTYKLWYEGINANGVNQIGYASSSDGINWTPLRNNPVFAPGINGAWDDGDVGDPSIVKEGLTYKMWYWGDNDLTDFDQIGLATSTDGGIHWQRSVSNPVLSPNPAIVWENGEGIGSPAVIQTTSGYMMAYHGADLSGTLRIGLATSSDGAIWNKDSKNPILDIGAGGTWSSTAIAPEVLIDDSSTLKLWFLGANSTETIKVGLATMCN